MTTSPDVSVHFAEGRDVSTWERRHQQGEVPDRWPYGLDGLTKHFPTAKAREVGALAPTKLLRSLFLRRSGPVDGGSVQLSWEEDVALRMLQESPTGKVLTGVIWATDTDSSLSAKVKRFLIRRALRRAHLVWALSRPQVDVVSRWLGPGGPPVRYLRFGVDPDFWAEQQFPQRPMLFSAGGDRDRDPATLLKAIEIVRRTRPDIDVLVQSRTALTPPDGVKIVPYLTHSELRAAYGRASVVAIATRPNLHASGMTVSLEAMAVGRPVVITSTAGIDDYVAHGSTGFLVQPGDHEAMARHIIGLLDDHAAAATMGRRARERVEEHFTSARMSDDIAAFAMTI